jgi:glycosyltransferase involved in cell wall biosynthesis
MRVVVNQMVTLGRKTGIGHYARELLRCLQSQAQQDCIAEFPTGWLRRVWKAVTRARPYLNSPNRNPWHSVGAAHSWLPQFRNQTLEYLRQNSHALLSRYFNSVCRRHQFDLYHEPNGVPFPVDCPTVLTVHDLSVLLYPQWHPADRVKYYEQHFCPSMERCVHFLAVSEFSRQEMIRNLAIAPERVTRTYNGIRSNLGPLPRQTVDLVLHQLGLPNQYVLYLGTLEPRKNVLMLLRAYCSLPDSVRSRWPFVLVGGWGWNAGEVADYLHREARHRGVIHLGYVKDKHLAALYNAARVLVYPSWYEGFGLPPLEMMACGGAVLASTAGALVETVGRRAYLIPPGDADGWRAAILRVLQDDDWWRGLRHGVQAVARPFTWERCAAETWQVYRRVNEPAISSAIAPALPPYRAA